VEFVDHKADDTMIEFGDCTNAVSLAEAAQKLFFCPRLLEAAAFNAQYLIHVAANEPADLGARSIQRLWCR
jgi:hypothetical protein